MSLVPYQPDDRQIVVLRHRNAVVVRDPASQRLELQRLGLPDECPTCHRPLRSSDPDRQYDVSSDPDSYLDPNYFRMLRAGGGHHHHDHDSPESPPSSPIRRLVQPFDGDETASQSLQDAEFVSSTPHVQDGSRIRREAFSPNYFKTFFVEEGELGRGGKGVVLLVRHQIDGCSLGYFACKRVPVGDDHAWLEKVLLEVELLAKLSHPNLVSYRHVWLEDVKLNRFGPSVACAYILQQYCDGGDLLRYVIGDRPKEATKEELKAQMRRRSKGQAERPHDLYASQRRLPFDEIYSLFKDITSGLAYLHGASYIHRDLKPSNCLLHRGKNGAMTCLISDFGEVQPENAVRRSTGSTGTISYCAPEVLTMDAAGRYGNFTAKSDIFSLGMILYFMCFGRLPYNSANAVQEELEDIDTLRAEITDWKGFQDERRERPDLPSKLYQLLKRLLAIDPNERPTASEVLNVMTNETALDGVGRGTRGASPSIGLHTRRIQNLDSPVPPSTPVPAPTRRATVTSSSQEDLLSGVKGGSPQPNHRNSLQRVPSPNKSRKRPTASSSQDCDAGLSPGEHEAAAHASRRPSISPPLLMPPPSTFLGEIRHRTVLLRHRGSGFWRRHSESTVFLLRLCIFLGKMASLSKPCSPYMINVGIGGSLVALAGLDLGVPGSRDTILARSYEHEGAGHHEIPARRRWRWGWRVSLVLLILHFLILSVTSRWRILCPAPHERWEDWQPRF